MCRNIRNLYNFKPPATEEEIHASSLREQGSSARLGDGGRHGGADQVDLIAGQPRRHVEVDRAPKQVKRAWAVGCWRASRRDGVEHRLPERVHVQVGRVRPVDRRAGTPAAVMPAQIACANAGDSAKAMTAIPASPSGSCDPRSVRPGSWATRAAIRA